MAIELVNYKSSVPTNFNDSITVNMTVAPIKIALFGMSFPTNNTNVVLFGSVGLRHLYTFLYTVDLSTFLASEKAWQLHKKGGFYAISSFTQAPVTLSELVHNATEVEISVCVTVYSYCSLTVMSETFAIQVILGHYSISSTNEEFSTYFFDINKSIKFQ